MNAPLGVTAKRVGVTPMGIVDFTVLVAVLITETELLTQFAT
jgi:hypothetical protein